MTESRQFGTTECIDARVFGFVVRLDDEGIYIMPTKAQVGENLYDVFSSREEYEASIE